MSLENARSFYVRVDTDEAFRNQLEQTATSEERWQIIRAAGYEFTSEEWETFKKQNWAASDTDDGELSEEELTSVSGGGLGMIIGMAYGSVAPSLIDNWWLK